MPPHARIGGPSVPWRLAFAAALLAGCGSGGTLLGATDGGPDCRGDLECRDDDPCNGSEWCDDGVCRAGEPPGGPVDCDHPSGDGVCRGGVCAPVGCGDLVVGPGEDCDDGNLDPADGCDNACRFLCRTDAECDPGPTCAVARCEPFGTGRACRSVPVPDGTGCSDADPCTTADACTGGACSGVPVDCDDGDPCTRDLCDPLGPDPGCRHEGLPLWYPDEDGDGWGTGATGVCAVTAPARHAGVGGDCCDENASVFPGRTDFHDTPYACGPDAPPGFDYDCSGTVDPESDGPAGECLVPHPVYSCRAVAAGWCSTPSAHPECAGVPACGESGAWQTCVGDGWTYWPSGGCDAGTAVDDGGGVDAAGAGSVDAGGTKAGDDIVDARTRKESPAMYECCVPEFEVRIQRCR